MVIQCDPSPWGGWEVNDLLFDHTTFPANYSPHQMGILMIHIISNYSFLGCKSDETKVTKCSTGSGDGAVRLRDGGMP